MFGQITKPENQRLVDLNLREVIILVPITLFIIWIGVYPKPLFQKMERSVQHLISQVNRPRIIKVEREVFLVSGPNKMVYWTNVPRIKE